MLTIFQWKVSMANYKKAVIDSIRVSLTNQQRIVILREQDEKARYLPIWVGTYEAEAITVGLQEVEVARPQTHDLLGNLILALGARLVRVEVSELRDDAFYANLILEVNGRELAVDCRPSDGLALAVRARVPIFVEEEVLNQAGVVPEEESRNRDRADQLALPHPPEGESEPASEGRLSIFEDFLQNLDLDNLDKPAEDDEPKNPDEPPA